MYTQFLKEKDNTSYWRQGSDSHNKYYKKVCQYCGTDFDIYPLSINTWCYKFQNKLFCSYNCMIKYEKKKEKGIKD